MKILVAVDIHRGGEATVAEAVRWATRTRARLDLVYVDEFGLGTSLVRDPQIRDIVMRQWNGIQHENRRALDALLAMVPEAHRGEIVYATGRAADQICALEGYDAVLVATHGRTGLEHFFLGSVAERVVRHAKVPVIVIRLPEASDAGR